MVAEAMRYYRHLAKAHDNDDHSRALRSLNLGLVYELHGKLSEQC
jgi:hypothetical protein